MRPVRDLSGLDHIALGVSRIGDTPVACPYPHDRLICNYLQRSAPQRQSALVSARLQD